MNCSIRDRSVVRKITSPNGHKSEGSQTRQLYVYFADYLKGYKSDGLQVRKGLSLKGCKSKES